MTILFISKMGHLLGLAMRCQKEGYPVILYTENELSSFVGDGIVNKPSFSKHLLNNGGDCILSNLHQLLSSSLPNLVVVDEEMGKVGDMVRDRNIPVFGSSHLTDTLISSRELSKEVMSRVGIKRWRDERGVRVECGMWWDGLQSTSPFLVWNENRFMTSSLGPFVDSACNIIYPVSPNSLLFRESVYKMERLLKKSKFRGVITISLMVTNRQVYGTSFSPFTPYLPSLLELYKGSVTDLLLSIASSRKAEGKFTTNYSLSLLLSSPPYPTHTTISTRTPLQGVNQQNLPHIYLFDVKKNGDGYESAGVNGELVRVSARGRVVGECKRRVMKTVSHLEIDDVQYRTDSTTRVSSEEDKLKNWGYL